MISRKRCVLLVVAISTLVSVLAVAKDDATFIPALDGITAVKLLGEGAWHGEVPLVNLTEYGNWYGPGYWGGGRENDAPGNKPPVDSLDAVAMRHDFAYQIAEEQGKIYGESEERRLKAIADAIAVREAKALPEDPRDWPIPAADPATADRYRRRLGFGFEYHGLNHWANYATGRPMDKIKNWWNETGNPTMTEADLLAEVGKRSNDWFQNTAIHPTFQIRLSASHSMVEYGESTTISIQLVAMGENSGIDPVGADWFRYELDADGPGKVPVSVLSSDATSVRLESTKTWFWGTNVGSTIHLDVEPVYLRSDHPADLVGGSIDLTVVRKVTVDLSVEPQSIAQWEEGVSNPSVSVTLRARVAEVNGDPVSGMTVRFRRTDGGDEEARTTDGNGTARWVTEVRKDDLEGLTTKEIVYEASIVPATSDHVMPASDTATLHLENPEAAVVTGRVVEKADPSQAIGGATVSISPRSGGGTSTTTTGPDGRFTVALAEAPGYPAFPATGRVTASGYQPAEFTVDRTDAHNTPVTMEAHPASTLTLEANPQEISEWPEPGPSTSNPCVPVMLRVKLVDAGGRGIGGMPVQISALGESETVTTESNGGASTTRMLCQSHMDDAMSKTVTFTATFVGGEASDGDSHGPSTDTTDVVLLREQQITAKGVVVLEADPSQRIGGATVALKGAQGETATATTGDDGRFSVSLTIQGDVSGVSGSVTALGYAAATFTVPANGSEITVPLSVQGAISNIVLTAAPESVGGVSTSADPCAEVTLTAKVTDESGAPLSGLVVSFGQGGVLGAATTNAQGIAELPANACLDAGASQASQTVNFVASVVAGAAASGVMYAPSSDSASVTLAGADAMAVRGRVVDGRHNHRPIADAAVSVEFGGETKTATTGSDGSFTIEFERPEETTGSVTATGSASAQGYEPGSFTASAGGASATVRLQPEPAILTGIVLDAESGERIDGAVVRLSQPFSTTLTAGDGQFTITDGLYVGDLVTISAGGFNHKTYQKTGRITQSDITITFTLPVGEGEMTGGDLDPAEEVPPELLPIKHSLNTWATPANPDPGQRVTVTAQIFPPEPGIPIKLEIVGTDGYTSSVTSMTNAMGQAYLLIPGGGSKVVDRVTVLIIGENVRKRLNYTF